MTTETIADVVRQHLTDNREQIAAQAVAQCVADMQNTLKWKAESSVNEQLGEFFKQHVAPAVTEHLSANREQIVATFIGAIGEQFKTLAQKMAEDMAARMEKDYERKKMVEAIFGVGRGY